MKKQNCCSLLMIAIIFNILTNINNLATAEKSCPNGCECSKVKKNYELKCRTENKMNLLDFSNFDTSSITSL